MNNLYFIESNNYDLIRIKINEILTKHNLSQDNLIIYDMEETNISEAIINLDTCNLFDDVKAVLCNNSTFLTSNKCEINHNINLLEKYLNNPHNENILIITAYKLDNKKKIAKLIKEKCQIIDTNIDLAKFVKEKTYGYKIDDTTIRYFLTNIDNNLSNAINELDKLMMFKESTKEITKNDIDLITIKKIECNIYELIDAIICKNKKKSLIIYNEMINYGEDVFKILIALANQIRLIYQVKVLKDLSDDEICSKLNLKNGRQVVALRYKINNYASNDLIDYLHKLSIIDEELKTGKSIDKIIFPVFIANL